MTQHIIIRGAQNSGKTTACGVLFEELKSKAEFSKLYGHDWEEIFELPYNHKGEPNDFIAVFIIDGCVVVIISMGDVADWLEKILDRLNDVLFLKDKINGRTAIDFIVCCARSRNRKNSTIEMLHNRIPKTQRHEFWIPEKSADRIDAESSKKEFINKITNFIKTYKA